MQYLEIGEQESPNPAVCGQSAFELAGMKQMFLACCNSHGGMCLILGALDLLLLAPPEDRGVRSAILASNTCPYSRRMLNFLCLASTESFLHKMLLCDKRMMQQTVDRTSRPVMLQLRESAATRCDMVHSQKERDLTLKPGGEAWVSRAVRWRAWKLERAMMLGRALAPGMGRYTLCCVSAQGLGGAAPACSPS